MSDVRRIVVDTDTGIDDAHTLLYLAGRDDASIEAITSVYGNCTQDDSLRNIAHVLRLLDLDVPLARGADGPLEGEPRFAWLVHGRDGLGDRGYDRPEPRPVAESAAEVLVRLGRERPGELDLLALGPLTNLALALRLDPAALARYRSVVVMGGSGPFATPGETRMVDANIHNDPLAAAAVFGATRTELVMVGVNVTATTVLDEEGVARLGAADTPRARFAAEILDSYLDFYRHEWGRRLCPLHDPLAAGVLLDRSFVTAALDGPVNVVTDGFSWRARLMVTGEGKPPALPLVPTPDTHVVTGVDADRFVADFLRVLTA
jgi:inosine-uridine nucleoside N-ribohydrolase